METPSLLVGIRVRKLVQEQKEGRQNTGGYGDKYDFSREQVADAEAGPLTPAPDERARILALLVVFAVVMVFWLAFYQNGYALTLWARDNTATTVSPEVFQAVDPLGIILFSLPLVALWSALRRRQIEPSTVGKITIGMLLTSATFGIMTVAALAGGDTGRVSPGWLISSYLLIAVGEICLSPMGLSLVTKVAPRRFAATMVGGWFAAASIGGYLAGFLGTYWGAMPHSRFFLVIAGLSLIAAVVLTAVRRWLSPVFTAAGAV